MSDIEVLKHRINTLEKDLNTETQKRKNIESKLWVFFLVAKYIKTFLLIATLYIMIVDNTNSTENTQAFVKHLLRIAIGIT